VHITYWKIAVAQPLSDAAQRGVPSVAARNVDARAIVVTIEPKTPANVGQLD